MEPKQQSSIAMADFQVIKCIRFSHQQVIHIYLSMQAVKKMLNA